jgi:hypothetical protein
MSIDCSVKRCNGSVASDHLKIICKAACRIRLSPSRKRLPKGDQSMAEFWTALGQPPRPSFNLVVTLALPLGVEVPEGPPVASKELRLVSKEQPVTKESSFSIGGKVFEATSPDKIISGAQVRLVERDQAVVTNEQGQFVFAGLLQAILR